MPRLYFFSRKPATFYSTDLDAHSGETYICTAFELAINLSENDLDRFLANAWPFCGLSIYLALTRGGQISPRPSYHYLRSS